MSDCQTAVVATNAAAIEAAVPRDGTIVDRRGRAVIKDTATAPEVVIMNVTASDGEAFHHNGVAG